MKRNVDLSDIEDLTAPFGRCKSCRSPFGMPNKDGMVFYEFDNKSGICTACQIFDSREAQQSRRVDRSYVNRINGR